LGIFDLALSETLLERSGKQKVNRASWLAVWVLAFGGCLFWISISCHFDKDILGGKAFLERVYGITVPHVTIGIWHV